MKEYLGWAEQLADQKNSMHLTLSQGPLREYMGRLRSIFREAGRSTSLHPLIEGVGGIRNKNLNSTLWPQGSQHGRDKSCLLGLVQWQRSLR